MIYQSKMWIKAKTSLLKLYDFKNGRDWYIKLMKFWLSSSPQTTDADVTDGTLKLSVSLASWSSESRRSKPRHLMKCCVEVFSSTPCSLTPHAFLINIVPTLSICDMFFYLPIGCQCPKGPWGKFWIICLNTEKTPSCPREAQMSYAILMWS